MARVNKNLLGFQVEGMKILRYDRSFFTAFLFILYAFTFKLHHNINNIRCMAMECLKLGSLKSNLCIHFLSAPFFRIRVYRNSLDWDLISQESGVGKGSSADIREKRLACSGAVNRQPQSWRSGRNFQHTHGLIIWYLK